MSRALVCLCLSLLLASSCSQPQPKQQKNDAELKESCRAYVYEFYSWYLTKTIDQEHRKLGPQQDEPFDWRLAINDRKEAFDPEVFRALTEEGKDDKNGAADIAVLEFDPFLNTNESPDHCVVGNIAVKNDRYWVEVYDIISGKKGPRPNVTPELMFKNGRWTFVNFHYGESGGEDLLTVLKGLEEKRSIPTDWGDSQNSQALSCRAFVQEFYDWYVRGMQPGGDSDGAVNPLLNQRSSAFSPELLRLLKKQSEEEARNPGEIVGMDFNLIEGSQDCGDSMVAGHITVKDDHYWVDVHGVEQGYKRTHPDVVPELIFKDGQWMFVNFHYGTDSDMLSILREEYPDNQHKTADETTEVHKS